MIPCVSVENMRLSDAFTIENFIPSRKLMYRAAMGIFKAVAWSGKIAVVVGSGNNGGDGFALACILRENGFECTVFPVSQKLSSDSAYYAAQCRTSGIPIESFTHTCLHGFDFIVDCLLGTGFAGSVKNSYREAIEAINASSAFVISADINSGMNGDTGEAELAVYSDLTVTIGYVKKGLVAENAGNYIKRLVCTDIGIVLVQEEAYITEENCPSWLDLTVIDSID